MYDLNRKIIFTHVPKTGGSTIEAAFGWNLKENLDLFYKFRHNSLTDHITDLNNQNLNYEEFFKFSCIRNPWDIAVSRFFHDKNVAITERNKQYEKDLNFLKTLNFDQYIKNRFLCMKNEWYDINKYFFHDNKFCIDQIIRYENYKEDSEKVFSKYNVTWPKINYNTKSRPKNTPYRGFYTNLNTKNTVEEAAKPYIELFEYTF